MVHCLRGFRDSVRGAGALRSRRKYFERDGFARPALRAADTGSEINVGRARGVRIGDAALGHQSHHAEHCVCPISVGDSAEPVPA